MFVLQSFDEIDPKVYFEFSLYPGSAHQGQQSMNET